MLQLIVKMLYFTSIVLGIIACAILHKCLFLSGILLRVEKVVACPEQQTAYLVFAVKEGLKSTQIRQLICFHSSLRSQHEW